MSDEEHRQLLEGRKSVFNEFALRVKLVLRLLGDARVPILIKLLPIGSLVYLLFPDIAPGPIDDFVLIWLGAYLFVELCPQEIVQEHMEALRGSIPGAELDESRPSNRVVDATFWEKDENNE